MEKNKIDQYKNWLSSKGVNKTIIYIREAEENNLNGTMNWEIQKDIVVKFCNELGLGIEREYVDTDIMFNNWELMELIKETAETKVNDIFHNDTAIVMLGIDRISKNVQEILSVATIFDMAGFELITVNEGWVFEDFKLNPTTLEKMEDLIQLDWEYYEKEDVEEKNEGNDLDD